MGERKPLLPEFTYSIKHFGVSVKILFALYKTNFAIPPHFSPSGRKNIANKWELAYIPHSFLIFYIFFIFVIDIWKYFDFYYMEGLYERRKNHEKRIRNARDSNDSVGFRRHCKNLG